VAVLGRHRQSAGPSHPHHVGAQVGEHHPRVRPRSDAAELDDLHPGQGPGSRHPFLTLSTRSRSPSVFSSMIPFMARLITKPGNGTSGSRARSNFVRVLSPCAVSVYPPSWLREAFPLSCVHVTPSSRQV